MGTVNTGSIAKLLWPGLNKTFGLDNNDYSIEYTDLFDILPSRKAYEEMVSMSGLGLPMEKGEGAPIYNDEFSQAFTYRFINKAYALGFIITKEAIDDAQYDLTVVGQNEARGLGRSCRLGKEWIGANIYNRAFDSNYTFGDGYQLIGSAQPTKTGYTWANTPATQADISEYSLEQALIDIAGYKDDRGNLIAVQGQSLHIPKELEFEVTRILQSVGQNDSANNAVNALKSMGKFPKGVKVNHYFTDTDAWFIRTNLTSGTGMVWFDRTPTEFAMDNEFSTKNAAYSSYFRVSCGVADKRSIYGSSGA